MKMSKILHPTDENIKLAAKTLQAGNLVALPTETVYGLAADASNPQAIERIFLAKNRPINNPLIVHIADLSQLSNWAIDIPDIAFSLFDAFWPGPLTVVLKKHPAVSSLITAGQSTVAIRMPAHPVTLSVLKAAKLAVAAPSANRHCQVSPTTAAHVLEELGDQVEIVLDGGACTVGIESTILNLTSPTPEVLRLGMISQADLEQVLAQTVQLGSSHSPRVPGSFKKHYSPNKPVKLILTEQLEEVQNLCKKPGVIAFSEQATQHHFPWITMSKNPKEYARDLYSTLRLLDHSDADMILIETPPDTSEWLAILDRLKRAATK